MYCKQLLIEQTNFLQISFENVDVKQNKLQMTAK